MCSWFGRSPSPEKLTARAGEALRRGNLDDALGTYRQAITGYRDVEEHEAAAMLGLEVGQGLYKTHRWAAACDFLDAAIQDFYKSSGEPSRGMFPQGVVTESALLNVAMCEYWLGCCQSKLGLYPQAIANSRRAAVNFAVRHHERQAGDGFLMWGAALRDYGLKADRPRLLPKALEKFETAKQKYEEAVKWGDDEAELGLGQLFLSSATVYFALADYETVISGYARARDIFRKHGDAQQQAWCEELYQGALKAQRASAG